MFNKKQHWKWLKSDEIFETLEEAKDAWTIKAKEYEEYLNAEEMKLVEDFIKIKAMKE